jgi:hypothetical protein
LHPDDYQNKNPKKIIHTFFVTRIILNITQYIDNSESKESPLNNMARVSSNLIKGDNLIALPCPALTASHASLVAWKNRVLQDRILNIPQVFGPAQWYEMGYS